MSGLLFAIAVAAFEPLSESPWLSGGAAAALFPRTHLCIPLNPSSIGLLEETSFAAAASRPFGFTELDRVAAAAGSSGRRLAWGGFGSYSGRDGYSEATASAAAAFTIYSRAVGGFSLSLHRLAIENYGDATEFSTDLGITAMPIDGILLASSCRGLFSSSPSPEGMGVVPRTVSVAAGICPIEGVTVAGGASMHQHSGRELSFVTTVEPYPGIALSASLLTPPVRMGFAVEISVTPACFQYGYSTHPDLPSGHSVCLSYGGSGFRPSPVEFSETEEAAEEISFPVDVNSATEEELMAIPGIGPSRASSIRRHIESNGPLESIDELVLVPGIGPASLERFRPYLTV